MVRVMARERKCSTVNFCRELMFGGDGVGVMVK